MANDMLIARLLQAINLKNDNSKVAKITSDYLDAFNFSNLLQYQSQNIAYTNYSSFIRNADPTFTLSKEIDKYTVEKILDYLKEKTTEINIQNEKENKEIIRKEMILQSYRNNNDISGLYEDIFKDVK